MKLYFRGEEKGNLSYTTDGGKIYIYYIGHIKKWRYTS